MTKNKKSTLPTEKQIEGIPWIVGDASRIYWEAEFSLPFDLDAVNVVAYRSLISVPEVWNVDKLPPDVSGLFEYKFSTTDGVDLGSLDIRKFKEHLTKVKVHSPHVVSANDLIANRLTGKDTLAIEVRIAFQRQIVQRFLHALWEDGMLIKTDHNDLSALQNKMKYPSPAWVSIPEPHPPHENPEWFKWYYWMKKLKLRPAPDVKTTFKYAADRYGLSESRFKAKYYEWKASYDESSDAENYRNRGWIVTD